MKSGQPTLINRKSKLRSRTRKKRSITTPTVNYKFNPPIGIDEELPLCVQKVLSYGGGFALANNSDEIFNTAVDQLNTAWTRGINPIPKFIAAEMVQTIQAVIGTNQNNTINHRDNAIRKGIRYIKNKGWVLKQADKNLGLQLMSKEVYDRLLYTQLGPDVFERVDSFPRSDILSSLKLILEECGIHRKQKAEIMARAWKQPEPAPFYITPKIHKPVVKARPITAQHSYLLNDLSKQLAQILNSKVIKIPAIAINSRQVVRKLEKIRVPQNATLVAYDVEACYPSIDIDDALQLLSTEIPDVFNCRGRLWLKVLELIMRNSYVQADGGIYRQKNGTAMGTAVAPAFANLYLHYKLRSVIKKYQKYIAIQLRYVDDGFMVIRGDIQLAKSIVNDLDKHSNLNLTLEGAGDSATFMDIEFYKGERFKAVGILDSKTYTKPISKFLYLHGKSNHPEHTFKGLVKGELIRFLRNTSSEKVWNEQVKFLFSKLSERGYTAKWLRQAFQVIKFKDRLKYLQEGTPKARIPEAYIKTGYHHRFKKRWKGLHKWLTVRCRTGTYDIRRLVERWPAMIINTRGSTIANKAISAKTQVDTCVVEQVQ